MNISCWSGLAAVIKISCMYVWVIMGDPKSSYLIVLGIKVMFLQVWGWNLGKCVYICKMSETIRRTIMVACSKVPSYLSLKPYLQKWLWGSTESWIYIPGLNTLLGQWIGKAVLYLKVPIIMHVANMWTPKITLPQTKHIPVHTHLKIKVLYLLLYS